MKHFWLLIILILIGCSAHVKPVVKTAVLPEIERSAVRHLKPTQTVCIAITRLSNEGISEAVTEKFIKKYKMVEAIALSAEAWNIATQNHFVWKSASEGNCPETIYIILTQTTSGWKKVAKFYASSSDEVGFTILPNKLIFIRPDIVKGKYGYRSFVITLAHEFGHAIGLDHVSSSNDIMHVSFRFKKLNQSICLNGCLKVGKETISNIKTIFGIEGKEVIFF